MSVRVTSPQAPHGDAKIIIYDIAYSNLMELFRKRYGFRNLIVMGVYTMIHV